MQSGNIIFQPFATASVFREFAGNVTANFSTFPNSFFFQNNNPISFTQQTSTSRVEAEIMEKAQSKTNFGLSAEGTYNIGISKGKSTTTFGVEAQQESSGSRKDFHEAVVKAAQEYSEERNLQIDTEESSSSEYTESGSISNVNQEISATYLFWIFGKFRG